MRRVDIVLEGGVVSEALRVIHRAGVVHLVPFTPPGGAGASAFAGPPQPPDPRLEAGLQAVEQLRARLDRDAPGGAASPTDANGAAGGAGDPATEEVWALDVEALLARVDAQRALAAETDRLLARRRQLDRDRERAATTLRLVAGLREVLDRLPVLHGYAATGIVVEARHAALLLAVQSELERLTADRCAVVSGELDRDAVGAVLVYPSERAGDVRELLGGRDLEDVALPEEVAGTPFAELRPRLEAALERLAAERADVDAGLAELRARHARLLAALETALRDRIEEVRVLGAAGVSDHLVVLSGWVPDRRLAELQAVLRDALGARAALLERPLAPGEDEQAPVVPENAPPIAAFEPLAWFAAVPRYRSLDPTPALALALPAFIGMMVGDVGYGAVLLALLAVLRRARPRSRLVERVVPVGVVAAISTIGFGVLFGELFGDTGARLLGLRPVWLDRREGVAELLVLAIAIGVAQVGFGLVLGVVNAARLRRRRQTAARTALLAAVAGLVVTVLAAARIVPAEAGLAALGVFAVALVVLLLTIGLVGPVEVMGALGNMLSYARLMAIGLASVMLGVVATRLGGLTENLLAGVLIAGMVHALNFVLGFFDASVQGIRLQYVEFFSKFVEPGGVRYRPFASALGASPLRARAGPGGA